MVGMGTKHFTASSLLPINVKKTTVYTNVGDRRSQFAHQKQQKSLLPINVQNRSLYAS